MSKKATTGGVTAALADEGFAAIHSRMIPSVYSAGSQSGHDNLSQAAGARVAILPVAVEDPSAIRSCHSHGADMETDATSFGGSMRTNASTRSRRKGEPSPLVLVVDDSRDNREMYVEYLTFAGFRTIAASDGAEAIAIAEAELPDVIVLDMSLPLTDGWAVTRRLKGKVETKGVFIIALTGHAEPEFIRKAKDAGCDEFIAKPCLPEQLMRAVLSYRRKP